MYSIEHAGRNRNVFVRYWDTSGAPMVREIHIVLALILTMSLVFGLHCQVDSGTT